jgi:hypothetical protein
MDRTENSTANVVDILSSKSFEGSMLDADDVSHSFS